MMKETIDILHVCASIPPKISGHGKYAIELSKNLSKFGIESMILALSDENSTEKLDGYSVVRVKAPRVNSLDLPIPTRAFIERLRQLTRKKTRFLVTHTRFYPTTSLALIIGSMCTDLTIAHVEHGATHVVHSNHIVERTAQMYDHVIANRAIGLASGCVAVGPASRNFLKHLGFSGPIEIVPNSTSIPLIPGTHSITNGTDGVPNVLFASRIALSKGIDTLLVACKTLERTDFRLLIAGDGPDINRAMSMAKDLGCKRVFFLGRRSDISELIQRSQVVVVPSKYDSLPSILLEAGAAGKRIIASRIGDIPYVMGDDYEYLFDPGDAEDLAAKIESAVSEKDFSDPRIQRRVADEFNWERNSQRFLDFLIRLENAKSADGSI